MKTNTSVRGLFCWYSSGVELSVYTGFVWGGGHRMQSRRADFLAEGGANEEMLRPIRRMWVPVRS